MSVSDLVGEIEDVRRRTRRASAGAAVPLALLGLLVAGAAPFFAAAFRSSNHQGGTGFYGEVTYYVPPPSLLDRLARVHPAYVNDSGALGRYWLVAVPVTLALVAVYYVRRARRTGISLDGWRVAVAAGAVFGALVVTTAFRGVALREAAWYADGGVHVAQFLNPLLVVAVAVLALAWVERSVAVAAAGVVFSAAVAFADLVVYSPDHVTFPWERVMGWGWATVILGGWLLLSAAVLGVAGKLRRP